jgi:hypothetical protein
MEFSRMSNEKNFSTDPENDAASTGVEANQLNPSKLRRHANDADEAMKAFVGHEGQFVELTPEIEKKLLRKIDMNLMPVPFPRLGNILTADIGYRCYALCTA